MATDPNLVMEESQPELGLEPGVDVDVLPVEPVVPEPEEVQVAGLGSMVKAAKKLADDISVDPVTPKQPPISEVVEGELILQRVPEVSAQQFRDHFNLPDDFDVKMPNMTRTMPDGSVVNVMNIEDDAVKWINNMHRVFDEQIKVATRGERSLDQIARSAKTMGMHGAMLELLGRKVGEPFNAEQMYRAIWVRSAMATELDRVVKEGTDEEFLRILPFAASIEVQTSGAIAESGRAMAVLSHAGKLHVTDASIKKLPELIQAYNITPETLGDIRASYAAVPKTEQRMQFLRVLATKGANAWVEAYLSSLLSSPVTHAVNIVGNAIFGAIQVPERLTAGAVGAVRTKLRRTNFFGNLGGKDRVYMGEAWEQIVSLSDGVPAGLRAAYRALRHEEGTFGGPGATKVDTRVDRAISAEYWNMKPNSAFGHFVDTLGIVTRFMGSRMLLAEDEFAKGITFHMELKSQARRVMNRQLEEGMDQAKVIKNGAKILAGQDAQIVKNAEDFAVRSTFQGDMGPISSWMNKGMSHPIMKIWLPFFKTPTNIIKETLQRTPLGAVMPSGFWSEVAQGGAKADAAIGRMTFGTGIFATVASMSTGEMIDGFKITGAAPQDKNAAAAWRRNGWTPYSFSLRQENGTWKNYDYGRLAPVAGILAMAADYAHYSQYVESESELEELFMRSGSAMYMAVSELPMLQGIFSLTELTGSEYEGRNQKFDRAYELLVKQVTGAVITSFPLAPTGGLTATVERTLNPLASDVKPSTMDTENALQTSGAAKGFYEALNRFKSRNPFFSDSVPPKLNLWGEKMHQCHNGSWCFISPVRVQSTKGNVVDEEMVNLGLGLRMPSRTQRGVKLTSDQYNEMIDQINNHGSETMLEEVESLLDLSIYQEAQIGGPKGKLDQMKTILTRRKTDVLDEMFDDPDFGLGDKKKALEDHFKESGKRLKQ
tara:strand:+ start:461 stop:3280 length:2820 start_codon:yes stop_codon:yes gene_type:complete